MESLSYFVSHLIKCYQGPAWQPMIVSDELEMIWNEDVLVYLNEHLPPETHKKNRLRAEIRTRELQDTTQNW
jgi:hypothetical protein